MSEYLVVIENGETTKLKIVQGGTKILGQLKFWELTPQRDVKLNRAVKRWNNFYIFGNLRNDGALYGQSFDFMCAAVEELFGPDDQRAAIDRRTESVYAAGRNTAKAIPIILASIHLILKLIFMPFKIIVWVLILTGLIRRH